MPKYFRTFWNISKKFKNIHFLFYYMYKYHDLFFVSFVIFRIFGFFVYMKVDVVNSTVVNNIRTREHLTGISPDRHAAILVPLFGANTRKVFSGKRIPRRCSLAVRPGRCSLAQTPGKCSFGVDINTSVN